MILRALIAHLGRLCDSLDTLASQVREAIARAVSRTVADAMREAVQLILERPSDMPATWRCTGQASCAAGRCLRACAPPPRA